MSLVKGWGMLAELCSPATTIVILFMLTSLLEKGKYEKRSGNGNGGGGEDFPLLPLALLLWSHCYSLLFETDRAGSEWKRKFIERGVSSGPVLS